MKYEYARVSTDGQSVDAQVRQLTKAGCKRVFRETASGVKTDRAQLRKVLAALDANDVLSTLYDVVLVHDHIEITIRSIRVSGVPSDALSIHSRRANREYGANWQR
jgi:hypothetical protein